MKKILLIASFLLLFISCGETTSPIIDEPNKVLVERDYLHNANLVANQGGVLVLQLEAKNNPIDSQDISIDGEFGIDFFYFNLQSSGKYHFRIDPEARTTFKLIGFNSSTSLFELGLDTYEIEVSLVPGKYKFQFENQLGAEDGKPSTTLIVQPDIEKYNEYLNAGFTDLNKNNFFYISSKSCRNCDLSHSDLSILNLSGFDFSNSNLKYSNLQRSNIDSCNFANCEIQSIKFDSSSIRYCNFSNNSNIGLCTFDYANLEGTDFSNSTIRFASMYRAYLNKTNFENATFMRADMQNCKLESSVLRFAEIKDSKIFYSNLDSADMRQSNLCGSTFFNCSYIGIKIDSTTMCPPTLN